MNEIQSTYLASFERIAKETLYKCGFTFEMLPEKPHFPEGFEMLLKKGVDEYLLSFSTHHLDFYDGVTVCRSPDKKFHYELRVLPPIDADITSSYAYNDADIERLVHDICLLKSN